MIHQSMTTLRMRATKWSLNTVRNFPDEIPMRIVGKQFIKEIFEMME